MRTRTLSATLWVALTTAILVVAATLAAPTNLATSTADAATTSAATVPTPAFATPPASGRKVYAHYLPPFPVSADNQAPASDYYARNYLTVNGEGGRHASYGGFWRDRPAPQAPLSGTDWQLQNLRNEIRQAKAAGINGFTVNIMSITSSNWTRTVNMMRAAQEVGGFKIVPNIDAVSGVASQTPTAIAAKLAELYKYSSAEVIGGEKVLSSFAAEKKTPSWWKTMVTTLETKYGVPIKFIGVFLSPSDANMKAFAPFSYGFGNWGVRAASSVTNSPNFAAKAHALGRKWMEPVVFQDARHASRTYAEASNTATGRASWNKAIGNGADFVQMVTWNDYTEASHMAPSKAHGSVWLDISNYYINRFKSGAAPAITSDHLYLSHRSHPYNATPTYGPKTNTHTLGGVNTPPRNTVEALVFLTSAARVTITSGGVSQTFSMPAGVSSATVPLRTGTASAKIVRGTTTTRSVVSPVSVTNSPKVLDYQYFAFGK